LKIKFKLILILSIIFNSNLFAKEFDYKLLSERRSSMNFQKYSLETKNLIVNQALLIMDQFYANREVKLSAFGKDSDPLPLLRALQNKLATISEEEFHQTMLDIFNLQHDIHASYYLPRPYACHRNILPLAFGEVKTRFQNKFVVTSMITDEEMLKLLPNKIKAQLGDELISYNGKSIEQLFLESKKFNPGANTDAMKRIFLSQLSLKIQGTLLAPKVDSVRLELKNIWGKKYALTLPWISRKRLSCSDKYESTLTSGKNSRLHFFKEFNSTFFNFKKKKKAMEAEYHETSEPVITWRIISNRHGRLGVLKISSFNPESLSVIESVELIKNLLQNDLADTDALVLDLRDNEGGQIPFGESLVQFFTSKKISPLLFKMRANESNRYFLGRLRFGSIAHFNQLEEAISKNLFLTEGLPLYLNDESPINEFGQVYFKPVGLLTNAICYSTCDMISAQFQDHEVGPIFGEDSTTGAGGANNIWTSDYYNISSGQFKKLPNDQDFGFSWRQTVRVSLNAGQLIENTGVKSDIILPVTFKDLPEDAKDQMRRILKTLRN